ncbi:MAG: DNA recombination protein RmuC [Spirochaetes bacterium]|nr:MAG: DNA recombination protein RmuC [Spirochaetota bacterium]
MIEYLVVTLLAMLAVVLLLQIVSLSRARPGGDSETRFRALEAAQERFERAVKEELTRARAEYASAGKLSREEISASFSKLADSMLGRMTDIATLQKGQLDTFSRQIAALADSNESRMERMRATIDERMKLLQRDNAEKLEQMRATVDEKLHSTLEKRLGESFKLVSDRLEMVYRGLGEMQVLAGDVGDLKKVLTNVKSRGTWGEIQLGALLEQLLVREQYDTNVATSPGSRERVEFAIRLPGRDGGGEGQVWLPIDAKFPLEDYQRILEAQDAGNAKAAEDAGRALEARLKTSAKDIRDKYIEPPHTTDFGIMYLPTEGLYAEALRRPGLADFLQRECRVVVAGPTTLAALLNSLQMGFRTLAIEKRSSEVWALLAAVKNEFGKFGEVLEKTQQKLREASTTIEDAARKSRTIERKLRKVEELPAPGRAALVGEDTEE